MIYYASALCNMIISAACWVGGGYIVYISGNYFFPKTN